MIYYVIPARKGSKGFPEKNRKLFNFTYGIIPHGQRNNTVVTTDDSEIIKMAADCNVIERSAFLCMDNTSIKLVMADTAVRMNMQPNDIICMLYLTFPERSWRDILHAFNYFYDSKAESMLCKMKPLTHPYLCIDNNNKQIIEHDLYRRQDYPEIWELCHFVSIFYVRELQNLNQNLYNEETAFMQIERTIDVDYEWEFNGL